MGGMASGTVLGVPLSLLLAERLGWASALWLVAALGLVTLAGLPGSKAPSCRSALSWLPVPGSHQMGKLL